MKILFIGFGNVAKEMARIFTERKLYPALDISPEVIGIFTKRHGGLENSSGICLDTVLTELRQNDRLAADERELSPLTPLEAAEKLDYDVLVELSSLSISGKGEPAVSHIRAALKRGKSVASANKGPVGFHYRELRDLAEENGALYLFESAVMDGAPVFNFCRRCMKGATITGFSGILNGTTNFILSHMEKGGSLEEGIKLAQEAGIAEADPSMDIDGWDPAAKTAALANVLMDSDITPGRCEGRDKVRHSRNGSGGGQKRHEAQTYLQRKQGRKYSPRLCRSRGSKQRRHILPCLPLRLRLTDRVRPDEPKHDSTGVPRPSGYGIRCDRGPDHYKGSP